MSATIATTTLSGTSIEVVEVTFNTGGALNAGSLDAGTGISGVAGTTDIIVNIKDGTTVTNTGSAELETITLDTAIERV